jgi:protein-S-isoprenylcysteine O-methyltransferase Ste14
MGSGYSRRPSAGVLGMGMPSDSGPPFRLWPPVAVGVPLALGLLATRAFGDPLRSGLATTWLGWALVIAFAGWNGWALLTMAQHRTGLLPGSPTVTIIETGPFALSRNPLYVGLLALSAGLSLLAGSLWALLLLPVEWALLTWGAVLPEEQYLTARFATSYVEYTRRVRRWL